MSNQNDAGASHAGMPLHLKMLLAFVIGTGFGLIAHFFAGDAAWLPGFIAYVTEPIGKIFLALLFMLVLPLLFSALVMGVAEMGDIRALGRVGWKTLLYTVSVSAMAVLIGLVLVNAFKPGAGMDPQLAQQLIAEKSGSAQEIIASSKSSATGMQMLIGIVPRNVIKSAADFDVLAVMFFAVALGVGLVLTRTESAKRLQQAIEGLFDVSMTLINGVIRAAPYAVACLMFNLAAVFGWDLLLRLGQYAGVVVLALGLHMFVVYPVLLRVFGGWSPLRFFRGSQEAMLMAFATASSNATLPTALRVADDKLNLPRRVSRFVLTVGATANQNGTALFEGVTVLFLAQFFGIELDLGQQLMVMFVCILGGIGTAGVPAGSLPVVALICGMVGVPPEGIGLILGVDRFLDMCRTTVNVTGDLVGAVVVSRGESDASLPSDAAAA
ncbi:dicarboxylate/amino acid:cation symporter [Arenimonas sp.]|uniref:dicarboxylate/amino acid:cation symporter n=1 Tax=Arenimonas sp. TaxID=1872635 RepID=UPI0039E34B40